MCEKWYERSELSLFSLNQCFGAYCWCDASVADTDTFNVFWNICGEVLIQNQCRNWRASHLTPVSLSFFTHVHKNKNDDQDAKSNAISILDIFSFIRNLQ